MKRILLSIGLFLGLFLFLAVTANAATVATWDMDGVGTVSSVSGYTSEDGVSITDMTLGTGLTANSGSDSLNSKGWSGSDSGDYIEFGIIVADGYEVSLDSFLIGTRSSNTGPGTIGIYTSLDNYTTAISTITQEGKNYSYSCIDLSSVLEDITITGDFTIRLYEIGNTQADGEGSTSGSGTFRIVNYSDTVAVQLTGTVSASAIPVPGAFILLGTGLMALAGLRRKNA